MKQELPKSRIFFISAAASLVLLLLAPVGLSRLTIDNGIEQWVEQDADAVKAIWARALGRVELPAIATGLQALEDAGSTFPPALGEFVAACRSKPAVVPPEHRKLLPPPDRTPEEIAAGHAMAKRIARAVRPDQPRDPAAWAYRVIARYRSGDRVVAHASYKSALEALHNLGREVPA